MIAPTRPVGVIVCNDDWATPRTDLPWLVRHHRPGVALTQESKGLDYRTMLDDRYGVRQRLANLATQGVAVVWDRGAGFEAIGSHGWQPLVDGADLLERGVVWQELRGPLGVIYAASAHRPPWRDRHLWPEFDENLAVWVKDVVDRPLLLGMDSNEPGGPTELIAKTGLAWDGRRIDGLLTSPSLHVVKITDLPYRTSDHHPLEALVAA